MFDEKRRQQDHYEATMAQIYYEHELAMKETKQEGIKQGLEQGKAEGMEQLILAMLKNGVSPLTIAQQTGLDEGKIKELADKNLA